MRKLIGSILVLMMGLCACAESPAQTTTAAPLTTPEADPVILTATPFTQSTATAEKFVPKQNDLIFIEFFAIT